MPSNLTVDSTSIDTSTLGEPLTVYSDSSCSISDNFGGQLSRAAEKEAGGLTDQHRR